MKHAMAILITMVLVSGCGGGAGDKAPGAPPNAQQDSVKVAGEAAKQDLDDARTAAENAARKAKVARDAAMARLAGVEAYKDDGPADYARAEASADAAEAAWRAAQAASEKAHAAETPAEAERHRAAAEAAQREAEDALADAGRWTAVLIRAHKKPDPPPPTMPAAPAFDVDDRTQIGLRPPPPAEEFERAGARNGVRLSTGSVRDGAAADDVIAYLRSATTNVPANAVGLATHRQPPVVRLVEGTNRRFADLVLTAVRILNAALPYGRRMVFADRRVPEPGDTVRTPLPDGDIVIQFAPQEAWPYRFDVYPAGVAFPRHALLFHETRQRIEIAYGQSSHILINTTHVDETWPDARILHIIVHELLHAFGFHAHTDPAHFPDAVLNEGLPGRLPPHVLALVEGDALQAAHRSFYSGVTPEDMTVEQLGPWSDTSFHVRGDLDVAGASVSFGVAFRNDLARPWASGPTPATDLAGNRTLSGTVTWSGALLGISRPYAWTVAGDARLAVELATLDGTLAFTGLEHWGTKAVPGVAGTGTVWRDGALGYAVRVSGNGFVRTGGDAGEVTGAFFGAGHEGMGGVLERRDLAAGFGGKR